MSAGTQIDYDALAKQNGAIDSQPIDYDALAKQNGAISSTPPPKTPQSTQVNAPAPSMWDKIIGGVRSANQKAGELNQQMTDAEENAAIGFGKSALQPAATIAAGIAKVPVLNKLLNMGSPTVSPQAGVKAFQQDTTPTGIAQKVGAGLEQTGEMAATGGPIKAAAETIASKLPFLGKAAAPIMRVGGEVLNNTGNAVAHGQDAGPAAAISGGMSTVGEALPFIAPYLKKSAVEGYSQALAPTKQENKYIAQKVVPELIDRRISGSLQKITDTADAAKDQVGQQIGNTVSALPATATVKTQPVLDALESYKNDFKVGNVAVNPTAIQHASDLQDTIKQFGPDVSYQSLNKARQILDSSVSQAKGYYGKTLSEGSVVAAQREAANAIRGELAKANPDIAKLNAEYNFWSGVQKVAEDTMQRRTGQYGSLGDKVMGAAGIAAGLATGGAPAGIAKGAEMLGVSKLLNSPTWKTMSAIQKARLADALSSGNAAMIARVASELGTAGIGQSR